LKDFNVTIESYHLAGKGNQQNVHRLKPAQLASTETVLIDIAADVEPGDYSAAQDPRIYKSKVTNRGVLTDNWMETVILCLIKICCGHFW